MAYLFVISHLIIKGAHYNNKILKPSPTMQQKTTIYIVIHVAWAHSWVMMSLQYYLRDSKKSKGLTLFIEQTKHEYAFVANYVAIFTINM